MTFSLTYKSITLPAFPALRCVFCVPAHSNLNHWTPWFALPIGRRDFGSIFKIVKDAAKEGTTTTKIFITDHRFVSVICAFQSSLVPQRHFGVFIHAHFPPLSLFRCLAFTHKLSNNKWYSLGIFFFNSEIFPINSIICCDLQFSFFPFSAGAFLRRLNSHPPSRPEYLPRRVHIRRANKQRQITPRQWHLTLSIDTSQYSRSPST